MNQEYNQLLRIVQSQQAQIDQLLEFKRTAELKASAPRTYFKNVIAFDRQALIGFFGNDPVAKRAAITAPSGGATVDSQARTAIGTIITTLQTLGLTS